VHGFSVSVVEDNLVISTLSHFFKVQSIAATNEFIFTSEGKSPAITFGIKALDNLVA
jgi:hypothetical protein